MTNLPASPANAKIALEDSEDLESLIFIGKMEQEIPPDTSGSE